MASPVGHVERAGLPWPSLVPPSSAVPTAADKQQYDDDDQKSRGVHIVLLKGSELGVDPKCLAFPEARTGGIVLIRTSTLEERVRLPMSALGHKRITQPACPLTATSGHSVAVSAFLTSLSYSLCPQFHRVWRGLVCVASTSLDRVPNGACVLVSLTHSCGHSYPNDT
jgi:hypothetical protein